MTEPLTPAQLALVEQKYPHEVAALCRAKLRYLWDQFATPDDALQAATLGLLHAVRTFDESRGCVFNTLLIYAMRTAMMRELGKGAGKLVVINKCREKGRRKFDVNTASLATMASKECGQWEPPDAADPLGDLIEKEHTRARVGAVFALATYCEGEVLHDVFYRGLTIEQIAWWRERTKAALYLRLKAVRERAKRELGRAAV